MELLTERLRIREFRLTDLDDVYAFDSNPLVCKYESEPLTKDEVHYRLEGALEWAQEEPRKIYKLAVTLPPDDRAIGRLSLKVTQASINEMEIGWTLHPDYWGQGYASEGATALIRYAFETLNAHRVIAYCHVDNQASVAVMKRIRMQPEGRFREVIQVDGKWYDELEYSILDREYYELIGN